ncbi:MAG TPA: zf-HC2 domain-containing protein [Acidimicrobiales bacterium]|nr:zf-HC2 domain-containing protein [Acidimicrobiales bacterium]
MRLLRQRDLQCQQAVELVTDYLEGALSRRQRRRFEAHMRSCPNCSAYLEQIQAVIATSGSITSDDLSPQARDDLTALYRRWRSDGPADDPPRERQE